jgi:hypothetical protein
LKLLSLLLLSTPHSSSHISLGAILSVLLTLLLLPWRLHFNVDSRKTLLLRRSITVERGAGQEEQFIASYTVPSPSSQRVGHHHQGEGKQSWS